MRRWVGMPLRDLVALATQRGIGDIVSMFARQHTYRSRYLGQTPLAACLSPGRVFARAILTMSLQPSLPETLYADASPLVFALVPEHALPARNFDSLCDGLRQFFLLSSMGFTEPRCQVYHRFLGVFDLRNACQN